MTKLRVRLQRVVVLLLPAAVFLLVRYTFQQRLTGLYERPVVAPSPPPPKAVAAEQCDIFRGEWVPDPSEVPPYTNSTCPFMGCARQPNVEFPRWRWKPTACELPEFDPEAFLELVRGKSMAFVGDSLARNHMASLLCLLSKVDLSVDLRKVSDDVPNVVFPKHNFYVAYKWSRFLIKAESAPPWVNYESFRLHLDQPDAAWAAGIKSFDYVIVTAGRWFMDRDNYFLEKGKVIGCNRCSDADVPEVDRLYAYGHAFRTVFSYLNNLPDYRGRTYLLTYSPPHFENGTWNEEGVCPRTRPWRTEEVPLEGSATEGPYNAQVEEFVAAKKVGATRGLELHLLDVTGAMLLRPDGHPGRYQSSNVKDCVHWCLPGAVDTWNIMLFEMLKRELEDGKQR